MLWNPLWRVKCPVHNYIPMAEADRGGESVEARELSHKTTRSEVSAASARRIACARGACTLNDGLGAVSIGAIENTYDERLKAAGGRHVERAATGSRPIAEPGGGMGCADIWCARCAAVVF